MVGEEILDFSLFNLAMGGDIRKLDNVEYRKDLARFVRPVPFPPRELVLTSLGSSCRLFPASLPEFTIVIYSTDKPSR